MCKKSWAPTRKAASKLPVTAEQCGMLRGTMAFAVRRREGIGVSVIWLDENPNIARISAG